MLKRLLSLFGAGGNDSLLSPEQFTKEFVVRFHEKAPDVKIEVAATCHLKLSDSAGHASTAFLDNAYTQYQQDPGAKNRVFNDYIRSFAELLRTMGKSVDRECIVPVLKNKEYLRVIAEQIKSLGSEKSALDLVCESLNAELDVFYVEDTPQNMQYVTKENLQKLSISPSELRALAVTNLPGCMPPVRLSDREGIYIVDGGGDYETSLLLLDDFWKRDDLRVNGEIIAAVPARGALFVTGSRDEMALLLLKGLAAKISSEAAYPLSGKLFIRRNGRFEIYEPSA